jgi:predicted Zn-dependent peptidase
LNALGEEVAASELQVVLREHALGEGSLGRAAFDAAFGALFPETHPYHSLSASTDSLGQLTLAHARWFHEQGYGADRVRLVLVGDFDRAAVRPMIEEYFGALRPSPSAAPESVSVRSHLDPTRLRAEQACTAPRVLGSAAAPHRLLIRVPYRQERLDVLWPVPAGVSVDDSLGVLQLWSGDAGQAAKEQGLAVDSGTSVLQLELAQFLSVGFQIAPGIETHKVEDLLWESLAVFRANGKSAESFRGNAQNLELERDLRRQAPLARALALAARHCQPTRCDAPELPLDERAFDMVPAFGREHALVLQTTYSLGTALSGPSVEVVQ